jgi:hypothetical protein
MLIRAARWQRSKRPMSEFPRSAVICQDSGDDNSGTAIELPLNVIERMNGLFGVEGADNVA